MERTTVSMDLPIYYAIAAGGVAIILLILQIYRHVHLSMYSTVNSVLLRYLVYPLCVNRHLLLGPWSRAMVLIQALYIVAVLFCSCFQISSPSDAAKRTGHLSLINLVPLYFGFQLSFVADLLGVSVRLWHRLHGTLGVIAVLLAVVHASLHVSTDLKTIRGRKGLYSILVKDPVVPYLSLS